MAQFNENIKIAAPNPIDDRYLSTRTSGGSQLPYSGLSEVYSTILTTVRYTGLTVLIKTGSTSPVEYWFKDNISVLEEKKSASEQFIGDFVTGATNLGYFSGQTGIQRLDLSGFPSSPTTFDGYYYSEYNWYYSDAGGIIRIGSPTHGGPLRRAYVNSLRTKSWIYDVGTSAWILSWSDVTANVGNLIIGYGYAGSGYTQTTWLTGWQSNGSTSITGAGSLTTGDTLTIGNPIFAYQADQDLNFRTIINETPEFLKIETDDNFIRFSGTSSVIDGINIGSGTPVFTGKTNALMGFRTLKQSGDTTIGQSSDGSIIIFSSSDGSGYATTGATNAGVGIGVYSGTTDRNLYFNSLIGSGSTTLSESGGTIIINSEGGGDLFTDDITVSIDTGKSFGRYENGNVIPASGKTANEVIILACFEAQAPTVNLSSSGNNVAFGESGKTVGLTFSYTINSLGASVATASVEFYSGSTWVELTNTTGTPSGYTHNIDDSANRFITTTLNYRYTVVDTAGATGQTTHNVARQTYAAPTMVVTLSGNTSSPETLTSREKGNVISNISGSINSNRSLVDITDWTLERRYDGGSYIVLASGSSLSTQSVNIPSTPDTTIPTSAVSIDYKLSYTDEYTSGEGGTQSISFKYFSYWGYNINIVLNSAQIQALVNSNFLTSDDLTWNNVTAVAGEYTYYVYPSTYSDISSIIKNGIGQDFGAWAKLVPNVTVTNGYGESLAYKVWKSNATQAYSGDNLVFS